VSAYPLSRLVKILGADAYSGRLFAKPAWIAVPSMAMTKGLVTAELSPDLYP
jgi:hypothetical protein